MALEEINIGIHTVGSGRAHRAAGHALRGLGRACVENRVILHVLRQILTLVKAFLQAGVRNIAGHNDGARERDARGNRVLGEFSADRLHRLVEVDLNGLAFAGLAVFLRNEFARVGVELFNPEAVLVDLALDVAVRRAAHAHADRTASAVTRQTDHADVVGHVLAAELSTQTNVPGFFEKLLFEFHVAEGAARFVTGRREVVVVVGGSKLHGEKVLLSGGTAHDEGDVVRRAGSRAEGLHLFNEEGNELGRIQNSLRFLIEVGLVGRAAALADAQELVFHAFGGFDVDLSRKVALRVHFVVHRERGVLRITQVFFRIGLVDALGNRFFIAETGPDALTLFAVNDGGTGVLAVGELSLGGHFSVTKERERNELVVLACFRILQNLRKLQVVRAAQMEGHIAESGVDHLGETFGLDFQDRMTFEITDGDVLLCEEVVLRIVLTELEHRRVFEFRCLCHFLYLLRLES